MKVVLLKDTKGIGSAWQVKDVADGHALNFLIPRKIATPATPALLREAENREKSAGQRKALDAKLVADRLSALSEERIVFKKKANEKNHLYDGLDAKEIAETLKLPTDSIGLEKPIKELGTFDVPVSSGEAFGKITVIVEAE